MSKKYSGRRRAEESSQSNGVTGVVLIMVSLFFLLCLMLSSFSVLSLFIRNATVGLVGYSAYPFFVCLLMLGIAMVRGKKAAVSAKNIVCIIAVSLCAILLLQLATTSGYMKDGVSNYIDSVYKTNTIGGVVYGIIVYGISLVLTVPVTYAFLGLIVAILLVIMFYDVFSVAGKKQRGSKRVKIDPERADAPRRSGGNLMRTVANTELYVDRIVPKPMENMDAITSESGRFDDIKTNQKTSLSKYGNKVEFEKYHKAREEETGKKYKTDAHRILFGGTTEHRISSAYVLGNELFKPTGDTLEAQQDSYERFTSNYIPNENTKKQQQQPESPPKQDTVAGKYGLREIAIPPAKNVSDKYVYGSILNGDEISDDLRKKEPESTEPTQKPIEAAPYVSNGGIINGDYFRSQKPTTASIASSPAQQKPTTEQKPAFEQQSYHKPTYEQPSYQKPVYEQAKATEQAPSYEQKPPYDPYFRSEEYEQSLREPFTREEKPRFSVESSFEALLKADKAIKRNTGEDDYYQPFEGEQAEKEQQVTFNSTNQSPSISYNQTQSSNYNQTQSSNYNQTQSSNYNQEADGGFEVRTEERSTAFNPTMEMPVFYKQFIKREDEALSEPQNQRESNDFGRSTISESIEQEEEQASGNQASQQVEDLDGASHQPSYQSTNQPSHQPSNQSSKQSQVAGLKIADEVIDKSETSFAEDYRTGYYTREGEDGYEQALDKGLGIDDGVLNNGGYDPRALEKTLNATDSFREKVGEIERSVFSGKKPRSDSQINIDEYLKGSAPSGEKQVQRRKRTYRYAPPPIDLLEDNSTDPSQYGGDCEKKAVILEETLKSLKFPSKVIGITKGPAVTRYEMETTPGIPIKRVENCSKDIAYALASDGKIRIETPIPGRRAIGIEVPNEQIATVCIRDIINSKTFASAPSPLTLALGKDITGSIIVSNLEKMPHLLIAGATGTGKSVCLNAIIASILYKASPEDVRLILIDPKRVEFVVFKGMPHLLMKNIITEPAQTINAFKWAKAEMERRYKLFSRYVVRNIQEFNNSNYVKSGSEPKMPYIVIIVDELSDLMMSNNRKELEDKIMSMAQKSRAAGIHLILATQRPSVDVITGTIKANLPSRIAFAVTSIPDSRTVLDQSGAEALLGKGDMLYSPPDANDPKRVQGAYITSEEVAAIVDYVKQNNQYDFDEEAEYSIMYEEEQSEGGEDDSDDVPFDPLMKDALRKLIETGQGSTSMIQRRFSVGYARAARIMDQMEQHRFVGPPEGSKPREVYISREQFKEIFGEDV